MTTSVRWSDSFLDPFRAMGDSLADGVINGIYGENDAPGVGELLAYLINHDAVVAAELPGRAAASPLVIDYLEQTHALPPGADPPQLRMAADFFAANGLEFALAFGFGTLPMTYCSADGANILYVGSMLKSDTRRRLFETLQMVVDVLTPDALAPGGKAVRSIQKVRLMHASIRYLTTRSPRYDRAWGLPVSQEDMAGTLAAIVYEPLTHLARMGRPASADETRAMVHTWGMAGRLLGLREELIPTDLEDMEGLIAALERRQFRRCEAGVQLTADLVAAFASIGWPLGRRLSPMLIREVIGDERADLLDVAPTNWTRWLYRVAVVASRLGSRLGVAPDVMRIEVWLGRSLVNGFLACERAPERSHFAVPPYLHQRWRLVRPS